MDDSPIPKIYSSWDLPTIVLTEQYDKIYKTISAEDLFYSPKDIYFVCELQWRGSFYIKWGYIDTAIYKFY